METLQADGRSRAQTREFTNLTAELLVGRRGPEVQFEGMRIGVKVEKLDNHDGNKGRDLDLWLFQVREHLDLTSIPERSHVPYTASLSCRNATLWWCERSKVGNRLATWDVFFHELREQFRPENYNCRGRDELEKLKQYNKELVAGFVFHFRATCLKINDLSEVEKLDHFIQALVPEIRLQVELRGPLDFHKAAMFVECTDSVISRILG